MSIDSIAAKKFADYTTRISFHLALSRNQVAVLDHVRRNQTYPEQKGNDGYWMAVKAQGLANLWVPGAKSLGERGLVEWHDSQKCDPKGWHDRQSCGHPAYALTEAGEAVVRLLEIARVLPVLEKQRRRA